MNQTEQRETRDMLVRDACFATDAFILDNAEALRRVTQAAATRLVLQAAIGYLIGQGLITATPADERPEWLELSLPDHLQPDLNEALAEYERINQALRS